MIPTCLEAGVSPKHQFFYNLHRCLHIYECGVHTYTFGGIMRNDHFDVSKESERKDSKAYSYFEDISTNSKISKLFL